MKTLVFLSFTIFFSLRLSAIVLDGGINDWKSSQQINLPDNLPPTLANGNAIYAHFSTDTEPTYYLAIATQNSTAINTNTTLWLNTDANLETGYKIWGAYSGAEYFINIHTDGLPYLYRGEPFGEYVAGPLEHSFNSDRSILELALPAALIDSPQYGIKILADINDAIFMPSSYDEGEFNVLNNIEVLPQRTDFSKRVAIVYSKSTKEQFYDSDLPIQKAYSQLYMSVQHQCMMAGIPYDLINEDDLVDMSNIVNYDTLIFPAFSHVPRDILDPIMQTLTHAVYDYGIGLVVAGDMLTNYADGSTINGDAYRNMKKLLGIERVGGGGPVALNLKASDVSHTAMKNYTSAESIYNYTGSRWYSYFDPVSNGVETQRISILATQSVNGDTAGEYNAIVAVKTGGRNVHFSSIAFLGDTNLLWSALQWSVFGDDQAIALKMGRYNNLFVSRNDMDQSQEIDEVKQVDGALYDLLETWKTEYNFVGSYFINIGNNPPDQQTDWDYSAPLYRQYIALGNEIGTHSYTHPHDTNILSTSEIEFEFNQSMNVIASKLNLTWREHNIRSGAVPGMPEGIDTSEEILKHLDYLTGGYSGVGAGYPSAFGYLTPESDKVYFSPNMSFDFTMLEFGIPVFDSNTGTWYPQPLSAEEAQAQWKKEYHTLMNHASQPIIHWPWHDYGPTTSTQNSSNPYSVAMFSETIKMAYQDNAEFITLADAAQRINTFKDAKINVSNINDTIVAEVLSDNVGKFSLDLSLAQNTKIKSVDNWYAYNDKRVFSDQDGGVFTIHTGKSADRLTHIYDLPLRSELLSVVGNGDTLDFTFKGEGSVIIKLKNQRNKYLFKSTSKKIFKRIDKYTVQLTFNSYGEHRVQVVKR